jgi:hypothetical protein
MQLVARGTLLLTNFWLCGSEKSSMGPSPLKHSASCPKYSRSFSG